MNSLTNIFIVGPMGVGKSTIGHLLANILKMTHIDSDNEIEEHTGATIPLIFEYEGEVGFRKREQIVIAELTKCHNIVLSTGGGVVLDANNRQCLKNRGYVIYLQASVSNLLERTAHSHNRPLLQTKNRREQLKTILLERHPLYTDVADVTIETGYRTIRQVVKTVLNHLEKEI